MTRHRSRADAAPSAIRLTPRTVEINGHASIVIGPDSSAGREIYLANPSDRWDHETERYLLAFGGHSFASATYVLAWGSLEAAIEAAGEYVLDRWPGFSADGAIAECYEEILQERGLVDADLDDDQRCEIYEEAEIDTMPIGGYGARMHSDDVHIVAENPTRADLEDLAYPGGPDEWRREDTFQERRPMYRPTRLDWDPGYHERRAREEWEAIKAPMRAGAILALRDGKISRAGFDRIDAALHGERFTIGAATF